MLRHSSLRARHVVRSEADWELVTDVLRGLRSSPKRLSPMYFYDERGSQLFEQICAEPEYYITRTETAILAEHAQQMASAIGEDTLLVELGSGARRDPPSHCPPTLTSNSCALLQSIIRLRLTYYRG